MHDYWLRHCDGFVVERDSRRLGVVEEVLTRDGALAAALVVRGGVLGRRVALVPADAVQRIVPRALRVVLHAA
jgi:hypothetical protein